MEILAMGKNPIYQYAGAVIYNVALTVTDDERYD